MLVRWQIGLINQPDAGICILQHHFLLLILRVDQLINFLLNRSLTIQPGKLQTNFGHFHKRWKQAPSHIRPTRSSTRFRAIHPTRGTLRSRTRGTLRHKYIPGTNRHQPVKPLFRCQNQIIIHLFHLLTLLFQLQHTRRRLTKRRLRNIDLHIQPHHLRLQLPDIRHHCPKLCLRFQNPCLLLKHLQCILRSFQIPHILQITLLVGLQRRLRILTIDPGHDRIQLHHVKLGNLHSPLRLPVYYRQRHRHNRAKTNPPFTGLLNHGIVGQLLPHILPHRNPVHLRKVKPVDHRILHGAAAQNNRRLLGTHTARRHRHLHNTADQVAGHSRSTAVVLRKTDR